MANIIKFAIKLIINFILMVSIISPILILIYVPLYTYRLFIILLSKIFRRDLVQIVPKRDTLFANEDVTFNSTATTVIPLKFDGDLDLESLRKWTRKLFESNNESERLSKNKKYAPLQQFFAPFGGFMFRKFEKNFNPDNHIREWFKTNKNKSDTNDLVRQEDLYELRRSLLLEPYTPGRSPWEFILIRNCEHDFADGNKTKKTVSILIAKFHHGLVDGFSLMQMLLNCFTDGTKSPLEVTKPLTLIQNIEIFGSAFALAPSTALSQMPKVHPENIFHPSNNNGKMKGIRIPVDSTVPVRLVKEIAKQTGTSFSAVIFAALTGGIRSYLERVKKPLPETVDVTIIFPWPGHPDRVGNHYAVVVLELPVGMPNASERLHCLQKKFIELKRSTVPAFNYINAAIAGSLPLCLLNSVLKGQGSSILLSNLPGPPEKFNIFGQTLLQPFFEGGYGKSPLGMGVTMFSYNGVLTISINPDEAIIPTKEQALQLLGSIVNEFDVLNQNFIV